MHGLYCGEEFYLMATTKTLITINRITHAIFSDGIVHKTTACNQTFIAWIENGKKCGPWHVAEELPTLQTKRNIDCMSCIAARLP